MRKTIIASVLVFFVGACLPSFAQKKIDGKIVKEVKEWRVEGSKKKLDHKTTYTNGRKTEEIEYTSLGEQKKRVTYGYNESGKCIEEKIYDEYNKLEKTTQYEYGENGKKKSQKTILPNGKLKSYKEFEYVFE